MIRKLLIVVGAVAISMLATEYNMTVLSFIYQMLHIIGYNTPTYVMALWLISYIAGAGLMLRFIVYLFNSHNCTSLNLMRVGLVLSFLVAQMTHIYITLSHLGLEHGWSTHIVGEREYLIFLLYVFTQTFITVISAKRGMND